MLKKQEYDKSVDWWCLGAVTYEMMYGLVRQHVLVAFGTKLDGGGGGGGGGLCSYVINC